MFQPTSDATVANRYRLVREIGRGGMGSVWEAFDLELEAPCALKFILNQHNKPPEVRSRFLHEARSVARLQSPHVVSIRSVGEWEGALYIAMELLVGETLFARLSRTRTLSEQDTSRLVDQIASVLRVAHGAGIVHRDLKPENVWLWSEADLFVKLLDFGVAKQVLDSSHALKTATGVLIGTPNYMSPEQAAGDRKVDHRSDLWSLALIAAECLSGRRTFQTTGLGQLLATILTGPTPDIKSAYPNASPELEQWWARATAREPANRYAGASTLADELAMALGVRAPVSRGVAAPVPEQRPVPRAESQPTVTSSLSPVVAPPLPTQALADAVEVWPSPSPDSPKTASLNISPKEPPAPGAEVLSAGAAPNVHPSTPKGSAPKRQKPSNLLFGAALAVAAGGGGWFTLSKSDVPDPAPADTPAVSALQRVTQPADAVPSPARTASEPPNAATTLHPSVPLSTASPPKSGEPPPEVSPQTSVRLQDNLPVPQPAPPPKPAPVQISPLVRQPALAPKPAPPSQPAPAAKPTLGQPSKAKPPGKSPTKHPAPALDERIGF